MLIGQCSGVMPSSVREPHGRDTGLSLLDAKHMNYPMSKFPSPDASIISAI